jgi:hypothetical protein
MKLGPVAVGTVLAVIALSGCGGSSTSSSGTTVKATTASTGSAAVTPAPGTPAALRGVHGGVLLAGDLPGFVPQGYRPPSTSAQSWVAGFPPEQRAAEAARLKALGFIAGITENLAPAQAGHANEEAVSLVEQFRSAHGATGEVANQVKLALARGEGTFAVAGIPGARGFGVSTTSHPDANVAFPVGAYYYLVGFSSGVATRAQLINAAQRLYSRVRG